MPKTDEERLVSARDEASALRTKLLRLQTTISKLETKLDGDGALTPDELRKFLAHVPVATLRVALYDWHTGQLWDRDVTENREMLSDTWWDGCPAMKKQPKKACVDELVTIYIDEVVRCGNYRPQYLS